MVDSFVGKEADFVEGFRDELFLAPVDIPVVFLRLLILTVEQRLLNTVDEEGFEFHLGTILSLKVQV